MLRTVTSRLPAAYTLFDRLTVLWDRLLAPAGFSHRKATRLGLLPLEDRVVPEASPAFAVGAAPGEPAAVRLYDQAGGLIRTLAPFDPAFLGGVRTALADLTGDRVNDVVAVPGPGGGPIVAVYDGATGEAVSTFYAAADTFRGGLTVAAGDVGNGVTGVAVGLDAGGPPEARVFTTAGLLRRSITAYEPGFAGGVRVALGYAANGNVAVFTAPGAGGGPRVRGFEVRSGDVVADFLAYEDGFRGGVYLAAGDLTGDGVSDVVTGAGAGGGPRVRAFGGQGEGAVRDFFAADPALDAGVRVGVAGDGPTAGVVALVAGDGRARVFGPAGTPTDRLTELAAGAGLGTPAPPSPVKAFDDADATPRDLGARTFRGSAAPDLGSGTPEVLGGGAGDPGGASAFSAFPVRYADGVVQYAETDLLSGGFGADWGVTRSWTNEPVYSQGQNVGRGWVVGQTPSLFRQTGTGGETLTVVTSGTGVRYFDKPTGSSTYTARSGALDALVYDSTAGQFVLTDPTGRVVKFWDFNSSLPGQKQGRFQSLADPAGNLTEVTAEQSDGRASEVRRSATVGGTTTTESYLFAFVASGANAGLVSSITQRRKVGAGSWTPVRSVEYAYYTTGDAGGNAKDLKTAAVRAGDLTAAVLETSYYRYYVVPKANQVPPPPPPPPGAYQSGLRYALGPAAYARAVGAGVTPETAADSALAPYADHNFEYDDSFRATKEVAARAGGDATTGLGTFTYAYTFNVGVPSTPGTLPDYNAWSAKTVETLPGGHTQTVYLNAAKQVMLSAFAGAGTGTTRRWFYRYDSAGREVLAASPAAVTGYDDANNDLVGYSGGNAAYLSDSAGLVAVSTYGSSTTATTTTAGDALGRLKRTAVRRGETGTDVPQDDFLYVKRTVGTQDLFFPASATVYRNDDGTGGETTTTAYTWQGTTAEPASVTTTLPAVTTGRNGSGTATSATTVYDAWGRPVWAKDEAGFLTYAEYDTATGAATKTIADVDTAQTSTFSNLPSGWSTPSGGGLHLTTAFEVDALGRPTKTTAPNGRIDYAVYDDPGHAVRVYPAWNNGTNAPTGPTTLYREDWARGYDEALTMSATPAVSGGRPTGGEAVSGVQALSRTYWDAGSQATSTDAYFNLSGLTYSTSATLGTEGTHYYRTRFGYDAAGSPARVQTPQGTVYRTVYDGQGRALSEWVGTDDTPTTGTWSPTNTAGTNLVKVGDYEYDGGAAGDGYPTKATEYPGLSGAARVTQTWYDWRGRPVAIKAGVQTSEATDVNRPLSYLDYDNLGRVTKVRVYDADGVTPTVTGGVPVAPSASLLRSQTTSSYDELGRVYRAEAYSVDPASGSVGSNTLKADTWYDARGLVIKTAAPGGLVTKAAYDGAGRTTAVYLSDGGGDSGYADADDVTGDAVLEQVGAVYDAGGNVLSTTTRRRFHDETATGALGNATTAPKARVGYAGYYYDLADRRTAAVDVGTNGGSAWTRPGTVPARSDTALVTSATYDAAGLPQDMTDPKGLVTRVTHDAIGRATKTVQNYVDGTVGDADDLTTEFGYNGAGRTSLTVRLTGGGSQVTEWVYGVTTAASDLYSNDVVGAIRWPDPSTGAASSSQQETVTVNALGQPATAADRNGSVHTYGYDVLGRQTADAVTTLGSGVDGAVRRVETAYDGQGNPSLVTTYTAASGGSVVNQVKWDYNGLGQLTADWQSHSGAVTGSTPKVAYAYSEMGGGANHSRPTSVTYPSGYVLTTNYASGLAATISRLSSLSDSTGTVEGYDYLGLGTVVRRTHPQPGVDLTYIKQSGESNGDAGDPYTGLDRFDRVRDQRWIKTSTGTATDRFEYGYDRAGDRTYRDNLVNTAFGELYAYDGTGQVTSFARGTLNGTKTAITGTANRTQGWDTDAAGNWDGVTTDGTAQSRTANRQNEVTAVSGATTPTFDASGNLTKDETGKQYVYDAWDRMVTVKSSGGTTLETLAYDGLGRRVSETASGTTTDLYYSAAGQVLEEAVGASTRVRTVWSPVYVDALVVRDRDTDANGTLDERLWVQTDANHNVTALVDGAGAVVERYAYDPFGARTVYSSTYTLRSGGSLYANPVGFQGLRQSGSSGFLEADHRWLTPTLGRWATLDPLRYAAGDGNLYRFVGNGPTGATDPTGLAAREADQPIMDWASAPTGPAGGGPDWADDLAGHLPPWLVKRLAGRRDDAIGRVITTGAGFGDGLTGGATKWLRKGLNADAVDYDYAGYTAGELGGTAVSMLVPGGAVCKAAGGARWMLRGYMATQAAGGGVSAYHSFSNNDHVGGTLHALGAIAPFLNIFRACFAAGTPIRTPAGWTAIERLRPGDLVLSRDEFDPLGPVGPKAVEEVFERVSPVLDLRAGGRVVRTTGEHPFFAEGKGWTPARDLHPGDRVATMDDGWVLVEAVDDPGLIVSVYNCRVAGHHTYFVGTEEWGFGLWSHNKNCGFHHFWPVALGNKIPYGSQLLTWLNKANHTAIHAAMSNFLRAKTKTVGGKTVNMLPVHGLRTRHRQGRHGWVLPSRAG